MHTCAFSTQEVEARGSDVQGPLWPHIEFEASLDTGDPVSKQNKAKKPWRKSLYCLHTSEPSGKCQKQILPKERQVTRVKKHPSPRRTCVWDDIEDTKAGSHRRARSFSQSLFCCPKVAWSLLDCFSEILKRTLSIKYQFKFMM